jgi:DNA-directed RNA polymerase sigma subunit (sigma70/sigma32)
MGDRHADTIGVLAETVDLRTRQMYAFYVQGETLKEVGVRFEVTGERVRQRFEKAGLPTRSVAESMQIRSEIQREELLRTRSD